MDGSDSFIEKDTIEAINQLRKSHPYAATLLCYVVVERILKLYLLEHDMCQSPPDFELKRAEGKLKIAKENMSAPDRNDAMHSNLYLRDEAGLPKEERHNLNFRHFEKACNHLTWVMENYSGYRLIEQDGRLEVKPK